MTRTAVLSACIVASIAGSAMAGAVEFRIVERRGQVAWTGGAGGVTDDNLLNFAVQARVVGLPNEALGNFGFDISSNDATADGTLAKARISTTFVNGLGNSQGTYDTSAFQYANNATVGTGGLAGIYAYLAGINGQFNGLINASGGSFTQNAASNDIGLVTGSPTGGALLLYTDTDADGNPDTYPGAGSTAPLDPTVATTYLGANANFVDVYHFNYTISSNAIRGLTFSLANVQAQTFLSLALANGVWGPNNPLNATGVAATGVLIPITPAPGAAALLGLGGLVAARRRRN